MIRLLIILFLVTVATKFLRVKSHETRLCYKTTAVYYAASTTLYHIAYRVENYTTKCLDLLIITIYCPASRTVSYKQAYTTYYPAMSYSLVMECCTGYTGHPPECHAICSGGCRNGGTCSSPEVCTCAPGWTGINCEQAICSDGCHNGGTCSSPDVCTCTPRWSGSNCEQESDIDECADSNGGCQHNCTNTIGSYHCSCAAGHDLNDDHHSCSRAATEVSTSSGSENSSLPLPAIIVIAVVGVVALALTVTVIILVVQRRHRDQPRNAQREAVGYPNRYALEGFENGGDHNHNSLVQ